MTYEKIPQELVDKLPTSVAYTRESLQATVNAVCAVGRFLLVEYNSMDLDPPAEHPGIVSNKASVWPYGNLPELDGDEALRYLNGSPTSPRGPYLSYIKRNALVYNRIIQERSDGKDAPLLNAERIAYMGKEFQEQVWNACNSLWRRIQLDTGAEVTRPLDPPY